MFLLGVSQYAGFNQKSYRQVSHAEHKMLRNTRCRFFIVSEVRFLFLVLFCLCTVLRHCDIGIVLRFLTYITLHQMLSSSIQSISGDRSQNIWAIEIVKCYKARSIHRPNTTVTSNILLMNYFSTNAVYRR